MSATTSKDVQRLQKLVLHNPTVIDCTDMPASMTDMAASNAAGVASHIQHYGISCDRYAQIHFVCREQSCQAAMVPTAAGNAADVIIITVIKPLASQG